MDLVVVRPHRRHRRGRGDQPLRRAAGGRRSADLVRRTRLNSRLAGAARIASSSSSITCTTRASILRCRRPASSCIMQPGFAVATTDARVAATSSILRASNLPRHLPLHEVVQPGAAAAAVRRRQLPQLEARDRRHHRARRRRHLLPVHEVARVLVRHRDRQRAAACPRSCSATNSSTSFVIIANAARLRRVGGISWRADGRTPSSSSRNPPSSRSRPPRRRRGTRRCSVAPARARRRGRRRAG